MGYNIINWLYTQYKRWRYPTTDNLILELQRWNTYIIDNGLVVLLAFLVCLSSIIIVRTSHYCLSHIISIVKSRFRLWPHLRRVLNCADADKKRILTRRQLIMRKQEHCRNILLQANEIIDKFSTMSDEQIAQILITLHVVMDELLDECKLR